MNILKALLVILVLPAGIALAQTNGMPTNPSNSQPGTTIPLNNGTTAAMPLNNNAGRLTTAPPMNPPSLNGYNNTGATNPVPTATP